VRRSSSSGSMWKPPSTAVPVIDPKRMVRDAVSGPVVVGVAVRRNHCDDAAALDRVEAALDISI
jgi:hypothetical protein